MVFNEQIYYALIVLLELMAAYGKKGCLLEDIANKHKVSVSEIEPVVTKLENACVVATSGKRKNWLLLSENPAEIKILRVIELFVDKFSGIFIDPNNGKAVPKNRTLMFLDEQRRVAEDAIRKRWYGITLERLYHMKRNRHIY